MIGGSEIGSHYPIKIQLLTNISRIWKVRIVHSTNSFNDCIKNLLEPTIYHSLSAFYVENGRKLPSIDELYQSVSLILVNNHRTTTRPRPLMPGIVYIGGSHIKAPKPLPTDLQEYIDNSKDGVIFFSMGSWIPSAEMPDEKKQIFIEVFSKLKQNVIWKFEDESLKTPKNVLIRKWLPQSDILAHPNVVLFISHGGKRIFY